MLAPNGFSGQIPFVSVGSEVGRRAGVAAGSSALSGDFVVEDVDVAGDTHRRLVFLDNQFLVQSEARLKTVKKKNKTRTVIDFGFISTYHAIMCVGAQLAPGRAAVLGLGGGGLVMFLRNCFQDLQVTAVELDPAMLDIAQKYFHLELDSRLEVQIKDGLDFLKDEAGKGAQYSVVMFDMDSKERALGLACPPPHFLTRAALRHLAALLAPRGHFILNLVCRDVKLHDSIINTLKEHFKHLATVKLYEEVNEIVFATNSAPYTLEELETAAKGLNARARQKNLVSIKCVDLKDFLQSVTIVS